MDEQGWVELGRRAVACKAWRWMPGMLTLRDVRLTWAEHENTGAALGGGCSDGSPWPTLWGVSGTDPLDLNDEVPDFRDDATKGCLLALVREVTTAAGWGSPYLSAFAMIWGAVWAVGPFSNREAYRFHSATEAEALVLALEASRER